MEGGLLLDVVVTEGTSILKLLASKDESLLVGWNACREVELAPLSFHSSAANLPCLESLP